MVKFNEGDRVEYNGWLGSIRELDEGQGSTHRPSWSGLGLGFLVRLGPWIPDEDRIIIETEDGVINFDDDEDAKIDPEFRFLSLRGIYEHVSMRGGRSFDSKMTVTEVDHVTLYAIKPISGLSQNEKHKWAILKLKTITLSQIGDEPQNGPFSFCNGENRSFWDFFSEFR